MLLNLAQASAVVSSITSCTGVRNNRLISLPCSLFTLRKWYQFSLELCINLEEEGLRFSCFGCTHREPCSGTFWTSPHSLQNRCVNEETRSHIASSIEVTASSSVADKRLFFSRGQCCAMPVALLLGGTSAKTLICIWYYLSQNCDARGMSNARPWPEPGRCFA